MSADLRPIGRLIVLPYFPALDELAEHEGDCGPCQQGDHCPDGAALREDLTMSLEIQAETARWN